jgi:hypothetical protein
VEVPGVRRSTRKKITGRKKVTAPKKTTTKTPRASAATRKAAPASSPPADAWEPGEAMPAVGPQAPPVGVIEVTTVEVLAVQRPFTRP